MEATTQTPKTTSPAKFGTFRGVFIPSILTILGVVMYLRLGWVVGNVGLWPTLMIVTMSTAITFLTALSISATATNMHVGGGGAYYMVSRSFGVEAGAAIGLPLYLAQALGISFYIAGFAESVHQLVPILPTQGIGAICLVILAFLAYRSADLALKTQLFIFAIILLSLVSLFLGQSPEGFVVSERISEKVSFWTAFAVFFPAVTGIEAGISMSGDLKNPGKSLPLGTLAAVLIGYLLYMILPVFLSYRATPEALRSNPMILSDIAAFGPLILVGIWGATLSSALGALLGAPRTLQALAKDRVTPSVLGQEAKDGNPRTATLVTVLIASLGVLLGDLDAIAPILSMFFLTSYGFLNLIASVEGILGNPSWRPTFRTPWPVSLVGAIGCFATMFMINAGATLIAGLLCSLVFYLMRIRNLNARWGDVRRSMLMALARYAIYSLEGFKQSPKSWRPHILVLSGSPTSRLYLVELADAITHGQGFLTVGAILSEASGSDDKVDQFETSIQDFLAKRNIPALARTMVAEDVYAGAKALVRSYGLGSLCPNTVLLGETEDQSKFADYTDLIQTIYSQRRNVVIVREGDQPRRPKPRKEKQIDIWWGGQQSNAGLMLALAYMIQTSPEWQGSKLILKSTVDSEEERPSKQKQHREFLTGGRVDAESQIITGNKEEDLLSGSIRRHSKNADLVFIGMRRPNEDETPEAYQKYYRQLLDRTKHFPPMCIVLSHEDISFKKIFSA